MAFETNRSYILLVNAMFMLLLKQNKEEEKEGQGDNPNICRMWSMNPGPPESKGIHNFYPVKMVREYDLVYIHFLIIIRL